MPQEMSRVPDILQFQEKAPEIINCESLIFISSPFYLILVKFTFEQASGRSGMRTIEFKVVHTVSTVTSLLISETQKAFSDTNKNSSAAKPRATASSKVETSSNVCRETNLNK